MRLWPGVWIVLGACTGETGLRGLDADVGLPVEPLHQTDRILVARVPEVDVLWVVDDSGSMADEQEALALAFPAFADRLAAAGLAWHVSVITTTPYGPDAGQLREIDGLRVLDPDTPDLERRFAGLAQVGTDGADTEQPLATTWMALDLQVADNQDFYRPAAALEVVVISDEDDSTPDDLLGLQDFVDWFDTLKVQRDQRRLSAVVPAEVERTAAVAAALGGSTHDLRGDFLGVIDELGLQAAAPKDRWYLSRPAVRGSLRVAWERSGKSVGTSPWTYDEQSISVRFDEPPPPGTVVVLDYQVAR